MTEKAEMLKAIAHPIRLCIVNGLINEPGCNVTKIQSCLDLPQSTISQHLAKLRTAGIVDARRSGLEVNYYVVNERIIKIVNVLVD
ncbi:MAG: winged helix-turn-helix transcriptional regulator [Clostridia bacterium]|nr:winged helix-turn-helix transcriptional regulator [Clostridia bacterium]